jgi:hypothetical protein
MRTHPDLVELRARYERAAQSPGAGLLAGLVLLAGLYLIISPWVIQSMGQVGLAVGDIVGGLALALLAVGYTRSFDRMHGIAWVTPVIGVWIIVSPWVIYHNASVLPVGVGGVPTPPLTMGTWLSNVIAGAIALLAGIGLTVYSGRISRFTPTPADH